jgi:hypothetical protein
MRHLISRFLTPGATEAGASMQAVVTEVLTSDKLVALQTKLKGKKVALRAIEDMDSPEYTTALNEVMATNKMIAAEQANILTEKRKAEVAEENNKRIAMFDDAITAYDAMKAVPAKSDQAIKDAAAADYATKREFVVNALIGSTPKALSTPKAVAEAGTSSENRKAIVDLFLAGKNHAEIELSGYAKSTVWHAINDYKKSNGLK